MTGVPMPRFAIRCDGCGFLLGADGRFANAMEARACAYAEGWRFPQKVPSSNKPNAQTRDVCPKCYPTWGATEVSA